MERGRYRLSDAVWIEAGSLTTRLFALSQRIPAPSGIFRDLLTANGGDATALRVRFFDANQAYLGFEQAWEDTSQCARASANEEAGYFILDVEH